MKKKPDEGRYSRVTRRVWTSTDFRELSAPKPNAQTLWFRLLTGPELGTIPGLFEWSEAGTAERLGWPVAALRTKLKEITDRGMAVFDRGAGVMWVPKGIRHNPPENPNVILGWKLPWKELPECPVKVVAQDALTLWCLSKGEAWVKEWAKVLGDLWLESVERVGGKASPNEPPQPSRKQEQEQEQEAGEEAATPAPDEAFAMHSTWDMAEETKVGLDIEMIPRWGIDALVARARTHYAANKSDKRRDSEWNQAVAKWVRRDWFDASKRPQKPSEAPPETTQTRVRTAADVIAKRGAA